MTIGIQDSEQVYKGCLPYPKFKLVHEVRHEHGVEIKSKTRKLLRKRVLEFFVSIQILDIRFLTRVGTREIAPMSPSTARLITLRPCTKIIS